MATPPRIRPDQAYMELNKSFATPDRSINVAMSINMGTAMRAGVVTNVYIRAAIKGKPLGPITNSVETIAIDPVINAR